MTLPLVDRIENLQSYDDALADLEKKAAACEGRIRDLKRAAQARAKAVEAARAAVDLRKKEVRELERDLEAKSADVRKLEAKYFQLQSEKEIEKYNAELARLQGEKGALEERLLAAMEAAEAAEAGLAGRERECRERAPLDAVDLEREAEEAARLAAERERLAKLRAEFAAGLPPAATELYEAVRARLRRAVAHVDRANNCGGCNLEISANEFSNLRDRERLHRCKHCGSILFLPPRN